MTDIFRDRYNIAASHTNAVLTSSGITTNAMKERVMDTIGSRRSTINALVITDGWRHFDRYDGVPLKGRLTQRLDAVASHWWLRNWADFGLNGQAKLSYVEAGTTAAEVLGDQVSAADAVILPAGNTHLLADGLRYKSDALRFTSRPLISEGAGSIVLGSSLIPAKIPPSEIIPRIPENRATNIVHTAVLPNWPNTEADRKFDIGGVAGLVGQKVMSVIQPAPHVVNEFLSVASNDVLGLHYALAAQVQGGDLMYIRP